MNILVNNLNAGEISPLVVGRVDQPRRNSGSIELVNFLPRVFGGVQRRPGTQFLGQCKAEGARLIPFQFSSTTAYTIEAGEKYFRFWKQDGSLVTTDGLIEEEPTPYSAADLPLLKWAQANDIMYLAHPAYPLYKLMRIAENNWKLSLVNFDESGNWPPMRDENVEDISITPSRSVAVSGVNWKYYAKVGVYDSPDVVRAYYKGGGLPSHSGITTQPQIGLVPMELTNYKTYYYTFKLKIDATSLYTFKLVGVYAMGLWINGTKICGGTTSITGTATLTAGYHDVEIAWSTGSSSPVFTAGSSFLWLQGAGTPTVAVPAAKMIQSLGDTANLVATGDVFQSGHVGSHWVVAHEKTSPTCKIDLTAANVTSSPPFRVLGAWSFTTGGTWYGKLYIERSADGSTNWSILRSWEVLLNSSRNITSSGNEEREGYLRIRFVRGDATIANNPYAVIESADPVIYSLMRITEVTDGTHAVAALINGLYAETATTRWSEGAWSNVRGFPEAITFHEQRLMVSSGQRIFGSVIGDWENFRLTSLDDGALDFLLGATQSNKIRWMSSIAGALMVGTNADEWVVDPGESGATLTPTTIRIRRESAYGSGDVPAVVANDALLFLQRNGRKWRELVYSLEKDGYIAPDLNLMAEHILGASCVEAALQRQDDTLLWCVLDDGTLASLTYERQQEVVAWARHETLHGQFLSVAVLPGGDNEPDQVWFAVRRELSEGVWTTCMERFHPPTMIWTAAAEPGPCHLDCATVAYSDNKITGIAPYTSALPIPPGGQPSPYRPTLAIDGVESITIDTIDDVPITTEVDGMMVLTYVPGVVLDSVKAVAVLGLLYESRIRPVLPHLDLQDGPAFGRLHRVNAVEFHFRDARDFTFQVFRGEQIERQGDFAAFDLRPGLTLTGMLAADGVTLVEGDLLQVGVDQFVDITGMKHVVRNNGVWEVLLYTSLNPLVFVAIARAAVVVDYPWQVAFWFNTDDDTIASASCVSAMVRPLSDRPVYHGKREILLDAGITFEQSVRLIVNSPWPFHITSTIYKLEVYGQ